MLDSLGRTHLVHDLPALIAVQGDERVGAVTWRVEDQGVSADARRV